MLIRLVTLASAMVLAFIAFVPATLAHNGPGTHERSGHLDHRNLPVCDASGVLARVTEKAAYNASYAAQPPVTITRYDRVRQTRHIGAMGPGLRERRWCQARAHFADGRTRSVYFMINARGSFVGASYGVESCIAGRDVWNVYGGDCSTLRRW